MGISNPYNGETDYCISVEECIQMCGLEPYADAIVGTLGCEQLKRTTVGVELVAKVRFRIIYICTYTDVDGHSHRSYFWTSPRLDWIHRVHGLSLASCASSPIAGSQLCARE